MNNHQQRLGRNISILRMKQAEIKDAKLGNNRTKIWSKTERYKLNMEMLTWVVNTDTLLYKTSDQYRNDKKKAELSNGKPENEEQGIMLGLYHAFNCFKHDVRILSPEDINTDETIKFGNTKYNIAKNEWTTDQIGKEWKKYKFYKGNLEGKSVSSIFSTAINFLASYYNKDSN